jgi:predicted MFS family arabinose efflux permease
MNKWTGLEQSRQEDHADGLPARDGCTRAAEIADAAPAGWLLLARLFLPFALGYFLSYFFRNINAVIAPQLTAEFALTASSVGLLTSVYFLAFAGMQIPIGLMVDRFGPRRVQAALLLIAAIGAMAFAFGETLEELIVARALIGAGVAGSLMVSFSAFVIWLPPERVPAASGFLMAFGGLGAFAAGAPTESFIAGGGAWRDLFLGLAVATVAVANVVFLTVPDRARQGEGSLQDLLSGLGKIYTDRVFWKVAPLTIATLGSAFALQGLWAGPWLMQVAHRDSHSVGVHLSVMAVALLAGSVACGPIAALAARFGLTLLQGVAVLGFVFIAAMAGLVLQLTDLSLFLWATISFLTNPMSMTYLALSHRFHSSMAARVNTGINALVLTGSFLIQWIVGRIIVLWEPLTPGVYPPEAFRVSFGIVLGCIILAWLWYVGSLAMEARRA